MERKGRESRLASSLLDVSLRRRAQTDDLSAVQPGRPILRDDERAQVGIPQE